MADNTVTTKFVADPRDEMILQLLKQQKEIDKLEKKLTSLGGSSRKGAKEAQGGLAGVTREATKLVTSLVGVGSAIGAVSALAGLIKKEYDDLLKRQNQAALTTQTAAQAVHAVRLNFAPDKTLKDKDLEQTILKLADETRSPVGVVGEALGSAFSAKGSLSNEQAVDAVRAALRITPGNAAAGAETAGRILDLQKLQEGLDPRAAGGFLVNLQGASRVKQMDKLGASAVPAIGGLVARGDSIEQAGELFATMSQLMNDQLGAQTGTTLQNLGTRLGGFVAGGRGKDARGSFTVPAEQIGAFEAAGSTTERIGVLQQNPELRRQFLSKNSFEAGSQAFVEQLLSGAPRAMAEFAKAQKNVLPVDAAQIHELEGKVGSLEGGEWQAIDTALQESKNNLEQFDLNSKTLSRAGTARKILEDTLVKVDSPGFDATVDWRVRRRADFHSKAAGPERPEWAMMMALQELLLRFPKNPEGEQAESVALIKEQIAALQRLENAYKAGPVKPQKVEQVNEPRRSRPPAAAVLSK